MTAAEFKRIRTDVIKMSVEDLAKRLDLSRRAINRYETGERSVHPTVAVMMNLFKDGKLK